MLLLLCYHYYVIMFQSENALVFSINDTKLIRSLTSNQNRDMAWNSNVQNYSIPTDHTKIHHNGLKEFINKHATSSEEDFNDDERMANIEPYSRNMGLCIAKFCIQGLENMLKEMDFQNKHINFKGDGRNNDEAELNSVEYLVRRYRHFLNNLIDLYKNGQTKFVDFTNTDGLSKHKRNFDNLGGSNVHGFKRHFDSLGDANVHMYKRELDSIGGSYVHSYKRHLSQTPRKSGIFALGKKFNDIGGNSVYGYKRNYIHRDSKDDNGHENSYQQIKSKIPFDYVNG